MSIIYILVLYCFFRYTFNKSFIDSPVFTISRLYYINLQSRLDRHFFMDDWLSDQNLPYERVNAIVGPSDVCVERLKSPERCKGVTGVALSNIYIIDHLDTSGISLILEDDVKVNISLIPNAIRDVPNDWDIIRFDCWGHVPMSFRYVTPFIYKTRHVSWCLWNCNFWGGTHAMLWRDKSVHKLKKIWQQKPYDDIDGRLTSNEINSYCVQKNIAQLYDMGTDIPKT